MEKKTSKSAIWEAKSNKDGSIMETAANNNLWKLDELSEIWNKTVFVQC